MFHDVEFKVPLGWISTRDVATETQSKLVHCKLHQCIIGSSYIKLKYRSSTYMQ